MCGLQAFRAGMCFQPTPSSFLFCGEFALEMAPVLVSAGATGAQSFGECREGPELWAVRKSHPHPPQSPLPPQGWGFQLQKYLTCPGLAGHVPAGIPVQRGVTQIPNYPITPFLTSPEGTSSAFLS